MRTVRRTETGSDAAEAVAGVALVVGAVAEAPAVVAG